MSPLRLRDGGDRLILERPRGGGWASDAWETVAELERLQVANLIADAESWLVGGASTSVDVQGRFL